MGGGRFQGVSQPAKTIGHAVRHDQQEAGQQALCLLCQHYALPRGPPCCHADVAARLAQRDQQDIAHKRKMSGRREGTVLDPCRLALEFKLADLGTGGGETDTEL